LIFYLALLHELFIFEMPGHLLRFLEDLAYLLLLIGDELDAGLLMIDLQDFINVPVVLSFELGVLDGVDAQSIDGADLAHLLIKLL
jgi:hypothetical protein